MTKKTKRVLGDGAKGDIDDVDTTTPAEPEDTDTKKKTEAKGGSK